MSAAKGRKRGNRFIDDEAGEDLEATAGADDKNLEEGGGEEEPNNEYELDDFLVDDEEEESAEGEDEEVEARGGRPQQCVMCKEIGVSWTRDPEDRILKWYCEAHYKLEVRPHYRRDDADSISEEEPPPLVEELESDHSEELASSMLDEGALDELQKKHEADLEAERGRRNKPSTPAPSDGDTMVDVSLAPPSPIPFGLGLGWGGPADFRVHPGSVYEAYRPGPPRLGELRVLRKTPKGYSGWIAERDRARFSAENRQRYADQTEGWMTAGRPWQYDPKLLTDEEKRAALLDLPDIKERPANKLQPRALASYVKAAAGMVDQYYLQFVLVTVIPKLDDEADPRGTHASETWDEAPRVW